MDKNTFKSFNIERSKVRFARLESTQMATPIHGHVQAGSVMRRHSLSVVVEKNNRYSAFRRQTKSFKCVITFTLCPQMHAFCTYQYVSKQCTRLLICINGENEVGDTFPLSTFKSFSRILSWRNFPRQVGRRNFVNTG